MIELTKEQKYLVLALVAILLSGLAYGLYDQMVKRSNTEIFTVGVPSSEAVSTSILVHISGAVRTEGVFKLKPGSRMLDAIKIAGGFNSDADLSQINLAQEVKDGAKILIPLRTARAPDSLDGRALGQNQPVLININTAGEEELKKIPGVGEVTAGKIIDFRQRMGGFAAIEDLKKVGGIGDKKLERMKPFITLN